MRINYPGTIINKSTGSNLSETYLSSLCSKSFLSLWSYPNLFRDQGKSKSNKRNNKGDGKELCDILLVFENHIVIFSDKECSFPDSGDLQLDWSRWFKRAIIDGAKQIWGAERWILNFPDRIFLDSSCSSPFPIKLPSAEDAIIHRVVVAHGSSKDCIKNLGGSGSLMIFPNVIGDMHIKNPNHGCIPFAVGQINSDKGYIHVFDDVTIEIVLKTLDTISDFTQYLLKKEEFIQSGKLLSASGEDDLLAYYLQSYDEYQQHSFNHPEAKGYDVISIDEGLWEEFATSDKKKLQAEANEVSYSWDELIEKFIYHITTGTSYCLSPPSISAQAEILMYLARENRTRRRLLATAIHELISKTPQNHRATRIILPSSTNDPYYLFLLLPRLPEIKEIEYRDARGQMLKDLMVILKHDFPKAKNIIGLATETGLPSERSEDLQYYDGSGWTEQEEKYAQELKEEYINRGLLHRRTMFRSVINEYPTTINPHIKVGMKGNERNSTCPCKSGKKFKKCCGREIN